MQGIEEPDGTVWPTAMYEVLEEEENNWRTIARGSPNSEASKVNLDVSGGIAALYFDLQPLRSWVPKARWGRIVLPNGDGAMFALEDLLPPREKRGSDGNFKDILREPEPRQVGSSAFLHSVVAIGGHLIGEFVYFAERPPADAGAETPEHARWPEARLAVGDGIADWHFIGLSRCEEVVAPGQRLDRLSPTLLRVKLDGYRSEIARRRYGKVFFSDDHFTLFATTVVRDTPIE